MTKTVRIYGVDVEFTDKAPTEDGVYWAFSGSKPGLVEVVNGYAQGCYLPHETGWAWSSPLVPKKGQQ